MEIEANGRCIYSQKQKGLENKTREGHISFGDQEECSKLRIEDSQCERKVPLRHSPMPFTQKKKKKFQCPNKSSPNMCKVEHGI